MMRYALPALVLLLLVRTASLSAEPIIPQWCPGVSLPNPLVTALIETESRGHTLALGAVIDDVHLSFYPTTKAEARLLLAELLRRTDNVGIGLMQVNYRWHVKGTGLDPRALLDGATNRRIGCRILGNAMQRSSSIWEGLGTYHSSTPERRRAYAIAILRKARHALTTAR